MSLRQVHQELLPYWPEPPQVSAAEAHAAHEVMALPTPAGALDCYLTQKREQRFLMTVLHTQVRLRIVAKTVPDGQASLFYRGWIRRGALASSASSTALTRVSQLLCADVGITSALQDIDFTHLGLNCMSGVLSVHLQLYGGCELHSFIPGLRGYIRLGLRQSSALFPALQAMTDALTQLDRTT